MAKRYYLTEADRNTLRDRNRRTINARSQRGRVNSRARVRKTSAVPVWAYSPIPAGSTDSTDTSPKTGEVTLLERSPDSDNYVPSDQTETLYNFTNEVLAEGASALEPGFLLAHYEGDRLCFFGSSGGEGGSSVHHVRFEMLEDMGLEDPVGKAKIVLDLVPVATVQNATERYQLDSDDDPETEAPAVGDIVLQLQPYSYWMLNDEDTHDEDSWEEVTDEGAEIRVLNPRRKLMAYGPYTNWLGEEDVFHGYAYQVSNNYEGSGFPAYQITELDSLIPHLVVKVDEVVGMKLPVPITETTGSGEDEVTTNRPVFVGSGSELKQPKQILASESNPSDPDPPPPVSTFTVTNPLDVELEVDDRRNVYKSVDSDEYFWGIDAVLPPDGWALIVRDDDDPEITDNISQEILPMSVTGSGDNASPINLTVTDRVVNAFRYEKLSETQYLLTSEIVELYNFNDTGVEIQISENKKCLILKTRGNKIIDWRCELYDWDGLPDE